MRKTIVPSGATRKNKFNILKIGILALITISIMGVASAEEDNWPFVLAFSVATSIPLTSIYFHIRNGRIKFSIYLFQLVIFSIFYPLTWLFAYLLFPFVYNNNIYNQALWAYSLFTISYVAAYSMGKRVINLPTYSIENTEKFTPNVISMYTTFLMLLTLVMWLRWYNGILFHIALNSDYNFNAGSVENIVRIVTSLCIVPPIFLLVFGTNAAKNRKHAFLMVAILVGVHLPTGLRSATMIPMIAFVFAGIVYRRLNIKSMVLLSIVMVIIITIQGNIRRSVGDEFTTVDDNAAMVLHRLSDLRNTGLLMAMNDKTYPPRGFDKMENFVLCYPPNLVRSILNIPCNTGESTDFTLEIGIATQFASEPITIIGDAFSRFGFLGIGCVGCLFGILVLSVERLNSKLKMEYSPVFQIVFLQLTFPVYSASLLNMLLVFCRDSLVIFIIIQLGMNIIQLNRRERFNESRS